MVSLTRAAACLLDHLPRRRFAGLIALFVLALGLVLPVPSRAQTAAANGYYYTSPGAALAACQSYVATSSGVSCALNNGCTVSDSQCLYVINGHGAWAGYWFGWKNYTPPANPCPNIPTTSMFMDGKVLTGTTFSENTTDSAGNTVSCTMTFSPTGRPIWNPYSNTWQTYGTAAPTGNPASTSLTGSSGATGDWIGPSGGPMAPQPTNDPANGSNAPPNVCGGGSCYDPSTDQYCSVSAGVQSCVSGATASSSSGGCTDTSSGGAICGGSPAPPLPNVPAIDPAAGISSTDTYTTANPTTGATTTTTINNYPAPGQTSSSGQTGTDSGPTNGGQSQGGSPAHASSAGGNGTLTGGTDCTTPPVCTGDSVLCGIAKTDWSATCQVHKDMAGDGTGAAAMASALSANPSANAWVSTSTSGNATADNANAGIYDGSGFGYGTQCPMQDLTVPLGDNSFVVPFSKGCVIGPWIAGVIKAFALFSALLITMGKRS